MSATSGTSGTRRRISLSAIAASVFGTATRTISQPCRTISRICPTVPSTSAVSVFVMDCTDTGAPPPICTPLTLIALVCLMPVSTSARLPKLLDQSCLMSLESGVRSLESRQVVLTPDSRLRTPDLLLLRRRGPVAGAEPAGGEFRHVVDDDEAHQEEQEDEADLLDALAHLHRELHPDDAEGGFEQEHEDHAAVQHRDGQEVEDAEVEAQEAEHAEVGLDAPLLGGALRRLRDAYRPGEGVAHRAPARKDLAERLARQAQHFEVVAVGVSGRGPRADALDRILLVGQESELAVGLARLARGDVERLVAALDRESDCARRVRLDVAHHLVAAAYGRAVEREYLVARLQPGLLGGRAFLHHVNHDPDGDVPVIGEHAEVADLLAVLLALLRRDREREALPAALDRKLNRLPRRD